MDRILDILVNYNNHLVYLDVNQSKKYPDYDLEDLATASYYLCIIGQSLRSHPSHLLTLFDDTYVPPPNCREFRELIWTIHLPKDFLPYQSRILKPYQDSRSRRPEMAEREANMLNLALLERYSPHHQWNYLLTPIWIWCEHCDGLDTTVIAEQQVVDLPFDLHLTLTVIPEMAFVYGTSAMESMCFGGPPRGSQQEERWLRRWVKQGGLPGILQGVMITDDSDYFCHLLQKITSSEWARVAKVREFQANINQMLVYQHDRNARFGISQRNFPEFKIAAIAKMLYHLYQGQGLKLFKSYDSQSWYNTLFPFLHHRLQQKPEKYKDEIAFRRLYEKHGEMLNGSRRRYIGTLFEKPAQILHIQLLKKVGCMRGDCPFRDGFTGTLENILRGYSLERVGYGVHLYVAHLAKLKLCSRCHGMAYCGKECQRKDWKAHRRECSLHKAKELSRREGEGWGDKSTLFGNNVWMSGNKSLMVSSSKRKSHDAGPSILPVD